MDPHHGPGLCHAGVSATSTTAWACRGCLAVQHPTARGRRAVHAVRDWILVMIGNWPWPNFNIADSLLVCGAGLLLWHAFRGRKGLGIRDWGLDDGV